MEYRCTWLSLRRRSIGQLETGCGRYQSSNGANRSCCVCERCMFDRSDAPSKSHTYPRTLVHAQIRRGIAARARGQRGGGRGDSYFPSLSLLPIVCCRSFLPRMRCALQSPSLSISPPSPPPPSYPRVLSLVLAHSVIRLNMLKGLDEDHERHKSCRQLCLRRHASKVHTHTDTQTHTHTHTQERYVHRRTHTHTHAHGTHHCTRTRSHNPIKYTNRLITGLITERGVCSASEAAILELFPEHV